jgi:2-polyprenyl-3-methyl-5-hydroxy-6-metoxy-1,4-benzoquinol methylase
MSRPPREHIAELMDQPDIEPRDLEQALRDLRRVNRWLGGTRTALGAVLPLLGEIDAAEVRVLDVATGSADIPVALARAARRRRVRIRVLATDLHATTVALARRRVKDPDVEVVSADGLALPFTDREFHVAMCHTALHHFEKQDAVQLISELGRVASHAVVITDLRRSRGSLAGVSVLARTVWRRHRVTRHDGVVSVRGAFTSLEAARLFRKAKLPTPRVRHHPFFRYSLVCRLGPSA